MTVPPAKGRSGAADGPSPTHSHARASTLRASISKLGIENRYRGFTVRTRRVRTALLRFKNPQTSKAAWGSRGGLVSAQFQNDSNRLGAASIRGGRDKPELRTEIALLAANTSACELRRWAQCTGIGFLTMGQHGETKSVERPDAPRERNMSHHTGFRQVPIARVRRRKRGCA